MRDVIAKDLWDAQQSAHAQIIDLQTGKEAATQVGSLLLTASLSTAVNAVKGLTREEMVECLVSPLREPSDFLAAFEELEKVAWYLHHTAGGPLLLRPAGEPHQAPAEPGPRCAGEPGGRPDPPSPARDVQAVAQDRATKRSCRCPSSKTSPTASARGACCSSSARTRRSRPRRSRSSSRASARRTTCASSPATRPPWAASRRPPASSSPAQKADGRIPKGHPQRDDLERKQQTYEQDFNATILSLFDKVLFPIQRAGRPAAARVQAAGHDPRLPPSPSTARSRSRRPSPPIRSSSTSTSRRSSTPSATRRRTCSGRRTRTRPAGPTWPTATPSRPACPGCRPRGSTRSSPSPATVGSGRTSATAMSPRSRRRSAPPSRSSPSPNPTTRARCACASIRRTPVPRRASTTPRTPRSPRPVPQLKDQALTTSALRVNFLVVDPSGQYETGDPVDLVQQARPAQSPRREGRQAQRRALRRPTGRDPLHARRQRAARRHALRGADRHRRRRGAAARLRRGRRARGQGRVPLPGQGQERASRSTT